MAQPSEHPDDHDHAADGHHHGPGCCHHDPHQQDGHFHAAQQAGAAFPWTRLAPCFLLLLWGGVMIYYFASGRVVHYLTGFGGFRIQALVCGLLLCVMALFELLVRDPRETAHGHDHEHDHEHDETGECAGCDGGNDDHGHAPAAPGGWLSKAVAFLVLALPLSAAALYSPDRYSDQFFINKANAVTSAGTTALSGGGIDLAKRAGKSRPLPGAPTTPAPGDAAPVNPNAFSVQELERLSGGRTPEGNIPLQLVELFYMPAQTRDVQEVVSTQVVETTGQAIKDKQDPTKMRLFRLMMTCCAADARPVSIPVEFDAAPPEWREMGWYKATGKVEYREINGSQTTVFKATSLTPSKPPRQQMMY